MKKIFIDGKAGTTGLRIFERLSSRDDVSVIVLPEEQRKDKDIRKKALNEADIVFLCLPDEAAIEAVSLIENPNTVVLDTSTAHRTNPGWAYGFPELSEEFEEKIRTSKRIAVPGCHASGFISLVFPLIEARIIPKDALLSCFSITGYSGGGKKMIADYESENRSELLCAPRQYGIAQKHKHLPEMKKITGLENEPVFIPAVADYYSGMEVTVPVFASQLINGAAADDIKNVYSKKYSGDIVKYVADFAEDSFVSANKLSGKDGMEISVAGNEERILLISRYDNLGKGASGAALECMNTVLGLDKKTGLEL
ncbi:MAG: N-acetyl-gamma-glutamyl-phosphate reductase [Oscillospiraceae bacterium]|nr:N-acetyl-gamma-glutamyl-phosphate reductase [Oscillospiraceae bacterium]